MATTPRPRHHQAANVGRHRPQLDPPRFTQAPTHPGRGYQVFPLGPGATPYRVQLGDLVSHLPDGLDKKMVFHICGDTSGVKNPAPQQHGETSEYYPQFYLPYEYYPLPIVGIPGNHDGDPLTTPDTPQPFEPSLSAWKRNFCSDSGGVTNEGDTPRQAMKQPNPFWTLETPKANLIGLYTNVPEGGAVKDDQKAWFVNELKHAARDRAKALFICLHHPIFSADTHHSGSPAMKDLLDAAIETSGAYPDIVFAAHVHNYQRFTRKIDDQEYTYVVAGAGGYWHLHSMPNSRARGSLRRSGRWTIPMSYWKVTWTTRMGSCGSRSRTIRSPPAISPSRVRTNRRKRRRASPICFNCNSRPTSSCAESTRDARRAQPSSPAAPALSPVFSSAGMPRESMSKGQ
jgi:acid phosphatase type 7